MIFCTCFDSGYLDKGMVLYKSLERHCVDFTLYIYCFDHMTYKVLEKAGLARAVLVEWSRFETLELLEKKKERTRAEYYWTCTPQIIRHTLDCYRVDHCVYIDADMAFYSDPEVLLEEIKNAHGSIGIMEHRFNRGISGSRYRRRSGIYCVEFNYFDNSPRAREALDWWADRCMEWCFHIYEPERMGDQKYLEKFPEYFSGVHVFQNQGAGVAPWNLRQYEACSGDGAIYLRQRALGREWKLIFYHYQNIRYLSPEVVNIGSGTRSGSTKRAIYYPYLYEIQKTREYLRTQGVEFKDRKVSSSHRAAALWQRYFLKFKIKSVTDVVRLDEVVRVIEGKTSL